MPAKPDLRRVWANGAPGGNIEDPDVTSPGKYDAGWVAEIPTFQNFNFLQQLFSQGLAHINEWGIPLWDADTEYPIGARVIAPVNQLLYRSKVALNQGNQPTASPTQWELAEGTATGDLRAINNLNDVASFTLAFNNIKQLATESFSGVLEVADTAESQAWAADDKIITPLKLALAFTGGRHNLVASGYQVLPGGLILQWVAGPATVNASVAVNFPIAFPNATLQAYSTPFSTNPTPHGTATMLSFTTTQANVYCFDVQNGANAIVPQIFAIGY